MGPFFIPCKFIARCNENVLTVVFVCLCAGVRDQPLDWQTAPPVHVLSYLVLGGKKDAMSKEVRLFASIVSFTYLYFGLYVCTFSSDRVMYVRIVSFRQSENVQTICRLIPEGASGSLLLSCFFQVRTYGLLGIVRQ